MYINTLICTSVGLYLNQGVVKTLTNLQSLDKLPYCKYIFYNWLAVVSCGPCGPPPSIAYGEGWSGQWLCAGPHPANTYSPPLRPRVHTYTSSQWPCRSVKKVPRAGKSFFCRPTPLGEKICISYGTAFWSIKAQIGTRRRSGSTMIKVSGNCHSHDSVWTMGDKITGENVR